MAKIMVPFTVNGVSLFNFNILVELNGGDDCGNTKCMVVNREESSLFRRKNTFIISSLCFIICKGDIDVNFFIYFGKPAKTVIIGASAK